MIKTIAVIAALIAVPAIAYGGSVMMNAIPASDTAKGPVACSIKVTKLSGGMTQLEGVVTADQPVNGSYRMRVTQKSDGGSSDIDQSGDFSAGPNKAAALNQMQVNSDGMEFDAELTITWPGGKLVCKEASSTAL